MTGDVKNAAAYCKALSTSKGAAALEAQLGTNVNRNNSFGKCVSATAKSKVAKGCKHTKSDDEMAKQTRKDDEAEKSERSSKADADDDADGKAKDAAIANAKLACAKVTAADPAKFARQYKNPGKCKKALQAKSLTARCSRRVP